MNPYTKNWTLEDGRSASVTVHDRLSIEYEIVVDGETYTTCLLYTSPSPRDS